MTNFMGKKSSFVDSGFVKTCYELVIGPPWSSRFDAWPFPGRTKSKASRP